MKKIFFSLISIITVLFFSTISFAKPKEGYVPNEETAVKVAEAVLIPVFGEKMINGEKPFHAFLKDDVWTVGGTLPCPKGHVCLGGVATVKLSKQDGRILAVYHTE